MSCVDCGKEVRGDTENMAHRSKLGLLLGTVFLVTVLSAVFVGCGGSDGGGSGSPSEVVKAFYSTVDKGDLQTAASYYSPGQMDADRLKDWVQDLVGNITGIEIVDERTAGVNIDGREQWSVVVNLHLRTPIRSNANPELGQRVILEKIHGIWKIRIAA